jgi:uncharacterized membrane protein YhaH (DUF805 family)
MALTNYGLTTRLLMMEIHLALDTPRKLSSHRSQVRHTNYMIYCDSPNLGAIIGGAIGGLTLLVLGLVVMVRRWHHRQRQTPELDLEQDPASVDSTSAGIFALLKVYKVRNTS